MSDGRTYWWACDAAWYDRERVADLVLMHGPTGAAALHWISCHAKLLNDAGQVKTGYSAVTKGIGGVLADVVAAVRYAAEIGALDDFEEDGKRFTCRVSGWESDQDRALGAIRQARWRARNGESRSVTASDEDRDRDSTEVEDDANASSPEASDDVVALCGRLASLMTLADPKAKTAEGSVGWQRDMRLLLERDKRTVDEVNAVITYIFDEGFWVPLVRSPAALRRRFDQIAAQAARPAPRRGAQPTRMPAEAEQQRRMAEYEARAAARLARNEEAA